jgi:ABC-type multidrug transport system fused ATPase/permease subunit
MKMDELNPQPSSQRLREQKWFGQQQSNESYLAREVQRRLAEMEKERIESFYPLPTLKELKEKEQEIKAELEELKRKQTFRRSETKKFGKGFW